MGGRAARANAAQPPLIAKMSTNLLRLLSKGRPLGHGTIPHHSLPCRTACAPRERSRLFMASQALPPSQQAPALPAVRARGRRRAPCSLPPARQPAAPDDLVPRPLPAALLCCCPAQPARIPRCLPASSLSSGHASSTISIPTSPSSRCAPTAPAMILGCEGCACRNRAACTLLVAVIRLVVDGPLVKPACLRC